MGREYLANTLLKYFGVQTMFHVPQLYTCTVPNKQYNLNIYIQSFADSFLILESRLQSEKEAACVGLESVLSSMLALSLSLSTTHLLL